MLKFKRILVACKLDQSDERVLQHAAALAELIGVQLHFLHVLRGKASQPRGGDAYRHARETLERALPPEQMMELDVRWEVREGDVVPEISKYIREQNIDLLVTGSHSHTGLGSVFSRNLTTEILRQQQCPVIVVPLSKVSEAPSLERIATTLQIEFGETITGDRQTTSSRLLDFIGREFRLSEKDAATCLEHLEETGAIQFETALDNTEGQDICRVNSTAAIKFHRLSTQTSASMSPAVDLLERAIHLRATDLHIDPSGSDDENYTVRMRVDGRLRHYCNLDSDLARHHIQQYKVLANIQIAEPFAPHEGSLQLPGAECDWQVRVTSAPVAGGESICMRIQSRKTIVRPLSNLGLLPDSSESLNQILSRGEGLVLVTGPTGSGKTTSVYSMLNALCPADHSRNIVTIEDPVEFALPFLRQMNINEAHGLTLAKGLTTMLRMDPDIVFVGEVRDAETALTAMRAASSGKYVFSTLHTRDVASTVTAMLDLGIEPCSLAGNLAGVISQRLVRRLCTECRECVPATEMDRDFLTSNDVTPVEERFVARGCSRCQSTGYYGRVGVFEVAAQNPLFLDAIERGATEQEVRAAIRSAGSRGLMTNALQMVIDGVTSLEEVKDMTRIQ